MMIRHRARVIAHALDDRIDRGLRAINQLPLQVVGQDGGVAMSGDTHPSTHPLLPPTTEDDRVSWLRLLRSRRVGPATFYRLMGEHGSADAALAALPEVARAAGVSDYAPVPRPPRAPRCAPRTRPARACSAGAIPPTRQPWRHCRRAAAALGHGRNRRAVPPDDRSRGRPQRLVAGHAYGAGSGGRSLEGGVCRDLGAGPRDRRRGASRRARRRNHGRDGRRRRCPLPGGERQASAATSLPAAGCDCRSSRWA